MEGHRRRPGRGRFLGDRAAVAELVAPAALAPDAAAGATSDAMRELLVV